MSLTPHDVDARLALLAGEVDTAHTELAAAERGYAEAKAAYEIARARAHLRPRGRNTVDQHRAWAVLEVADELTAIRAAEAVVRAARANVSRVETHVRIAQSRGANVRTGWATTPT